MGAFNSKAFAEMLENEMPPTPPANRRVLDSMLDPRSPTSEITRTPIQVAKTPDSLLDPRSPTVGIPRTPIHSNKGEEIDTFESDLQNLTISSADDSDSSLLKDTSYENSLDLELNTILPPLGDCEDSMENIHRSHSEPDLTKELVSSSEAPHSSSFKEKSGKKHHHKTLFKKHTNMEGERSPLSVIGEVRSPLSSRKTHDYNSPRAIMQRKQVNKLGLKKGNKMVPSKLISRPSGRNYQHIDDKENQ